MEKITKRLFREDGTPRPVGVIGYPVAHSRSPFFQNAAFEYYGLPHRYQKWEVAPANLESFIREMRGEDFLGINVTVPHKERVAELLEASTPEVAATGAANTLYLRDDLSLGGHNTDIGGFLEALKGDGFNPEGARALVIGAGGAARAVVYALATAGAVEIRVANRNPERGAELATYFAARFPQCPIRPVPFDPESWPADLQPGNLVVNATSYGLKQEERERDFPLKLDTLVNGSPEACFFDLLYGETPFIRSARGVRNALVLDGSSMLVYQGALSFELWTGLDAPREIMLEALQKSYTNVQ